MTPSRAAQEEPTSPRTEDVLRRLQEQLYRIPTHGKSALYFRAAVDEILDTWSAEWREAAAATSSLDAERLAKALEILNDYRTRGVTWQAEAYGSGRLTHFGFADEIAAEYARLDEGSATPEQKR